MDVINTITAKFSTMGIWFIAIILGALRLISCSQVAPSLAPSPSPLTSTESRPVATPASTTGPRPAFGTQEAGEPQPLGPGEVRLEVVEGTKASYLVTEQLARFAFPNDAVGQTQSVDGVFVFGPDHAILRHRSQLSVDLRTLTSDAERRDRFLRRRTLQIQLHPFAVFVPRDARGLPSPLPKEGQFAFELVGDITIHDVSREVAWDTTATFAGDEVIGQATTEFPFAAFGLTRPRVRVVLSVEDRIRLRLDFRLKRYGG